MSKLRNPNFKVSEIFYTLQGEGPNTGVPSVFVRLALCNLSCKWCDSIAKDSLVLTEKGWKKIQNIKIDEQILGVKQEKLHPISNRWFYEKSKCTSINSHFGKGIKITTEDGKEIVSTLNHPFLSQIKKKTTNYSYNLVWDWVKAEDLKIGDTLWGVQEPEEFEETQDFMVGWLCGYNDGDGGWSSNETKVRRFETVSNEIKDRLIRYIEYFDEKYYLRQRKIKNGFIWQIDSRIPIDIMSFHNEREFKRGYISGIFDAEGSNNNTTAVITNKDNNIINICVNFLNYFNFRTSVNSSKDGCKNVNILGGGIERLRFDSTFLYAKTHRNIWLWNEKGRRGASQKTKKRQFKNKIKIEKIEKLKEDIEFYDIGSLCGNFISNGVVVHNTPYTWDWKKYNPEEQIHIYTVQELFNAIRDKIPYLTYEVPNIVFTGGEPLLQQENIYELSAKLINAFFGKIEIETNGTIFPEEPQMIDQYNVSPKLNNSSNKESLRYKPDVLKKFAKLDNAIFKFVISNEEDLKEIIDIIKFCEIQQQKVYLMPECRNREELKEKTKDIADICLKYGFNFCNRLQIDIWNDKRAV